MTSVGPRPRRRWVWVLVAVATAAAFAVPFRLQFVAKGGGSHHELDPPVAYRHGISDLQCGRTEASRSRSGPAGRARSR
jgi:hypothetical protein